MRVVGGVRINGINDDWELNVSLCIEKESFNVFLPIS